MTAPFPPASLVWTELEPGSIWAAEADGWRWRVLGPASGLCAGPAIWSARGWSLVENVADPARARRIAERWHTALMEVPQRHRAACAAAGRLGGLGMDDPCGAACDWFRRRHAAIVTWQDLVA